MVSTIHKEISNDQNFSFHNVSPLLKNFNISILPPDFSGIRCERPPAPSVSLSGAASALNKPPSG